MSIKLLTSQKGGVLEWAISTPLQHVMAAAVLFAASGVILLLFLPTILAGMLATVVVGGVYVNPVHPLLRGSSLLSGLVFVALIARWNVLTLRR